MVQTYPEAVRYLYQNLPMFQRVGSVAFRPDLRNTIELCSALGDPHQKFRSIHIAGTNGKGSTSHMLASILQSAGYKTGLYTSPHLKEFTERIRVNGKDVSESFVVDFVNRITTSIEKLQPSFFEITVAMAFEYFAQQKVDIAVVEVGLGGRLDATNVITPVSSVITNIGWDHKDLLGDTLVKIAGEKAGIIKENVPVVVSERQTDIEDVFIQIAKEKNATIRFGSDTYSVNQRTTTGYYYYDVIKDGVSYLSKLEIPLQGLYQQKNVAGVLAACDVLNEQGFNIKEDVIRHGLENVLKQTNFKGRWQKLSEVPLMVCDTAHNIDGVRMIVDQIKKQNARHLHMVWGMVKDKDIGGVLSILPREATYYFCQADIPRALDASVLAEQAKAFGLTGMIVPDVNDAIRQALVNAQENDFIFIGGSTFVVAEINGL